MDLATLLGIIIGFVMVVIGIITSTTNPTLKGIMDTFVDIPSIAVTIGGSMAGMLTSYTFKTFLGHLKGFGIAMILSLIMDRLFLRLLSFLTQPEKKAFLHLKKWHRDLMMSL